MNLGHIERGMKLMIFEELDQRAVSEEYEAVFRYVDSGKKFVVHCPTLYDSYDRLASKTQLRVSFVTGPKTHKFIGRAFDENIAETTEETARPLIGKCPNEDYRGV